MEKKISYLNRTYADYKEALIAMSEKYYPDLAASFDDASIAAWQIDVAADIADNLSYHIDRVYQETNIDSAQERASLYSIARNNGVKIPGPKGSMAEMKLTVILPIDNNEPNYDVAPIIKRGTRFSSSSQQFELLEDVDFASQFDENGVSISGDGAFTVDMTNFKLDKNGNTDIKGKMHATVLDIEDFNTDKEYNSSMKMKDSRAVLRVTNENFLQQNNNTEYDASIMYGISDNSSNSRIMNSFNDRNTDLYINAEIEMSANEKESLIQIKANNLNTNMNPLIQMYSSKNGAHINIGFGNQFLTLYQSLNGNGYILLRSNGKSLFLDRETIPHFTGTKSNIQEQIDNLSSVIGGITYDADTETIVVSEAMTGIYYDDETIYL